MPKLLITGVYYPGGGLSNVMEQLAHHLGSRFEVACLGFIPAGIQAPETFLPGCRFIPVPVHNLFRVRDPEILHQLIEEEEYHNVLLLGPIHLNRAFIKQLAPFNANLVAYTAYEGKMKHAYDIEHLKQLDHCFFYTKHDYQCYTNMLLAEGYGKEAADRVGFIGHGTDPCFYPLHENPKEKRNIARKQIEQHTQLPADSFIILNSNRPYYRKRLDLTLEAFRLFSKEKKNVYLHFHLGFASENEKQLLQKNIREAGLDGKVLLSSSSRESPLSKEWMNLLYNACDVGVTTSMGEGWGMGLFEHAATNAPIIAPAHTSFLENWQGIGILAEVCKSQFVFYENAEMFEVDPVDMAAALEKLYSDSTLVEKIAKRCKQHASSPEFSWENTATNIALQLTGKRKHVTLKIIKNGKTKQLEYNKRGSTFDTRLQ